MAFDIPSLATEAAKAPGLIAGEFGGREQTLCASVKNFVEGKILLQGQATTDGSGQIAISGLTSSGVVLVTLAEDPGNDLVLSHVVAGTGVLTVFSKDASAASPIAAAALPSILVNYIVVSL